MPGQSQEDNQSTNDVSFITFLGGNRTVIHRAKTAKRFFANIYLKWLCVDRSVDRRSSFSLLDSSGNFS